MTVTRAVPFTVFQPIDKKVVAAREAFCQACDSISQINGLLVDLQVFEHEGHRHPNAGTGEQEIRHATRFARPWPGDRR